MIKLKQTILLLVSLFSSHAFAWDQNFRGDYLNPAYETGSYTNGAFNHREFKESPNPKPLPKTPQINLKADADKVFDYDSFSLAMVLIDKGKIVYERNSENSNTEFNSWSMAKSLTNIIVGQALCQGDIKSINDKAYQYVPDIKGTAYGDSTIQELLTMTSGAPDPGNFGGEMKGSNFELTRGFKSQRDFIHRDGAIQGERGKFAYDGLHADTLGLVLDSLKGRKVYVQNFLNQAGVESKSHWLTDKDNTINAAYGFGLTLDDWAKVAQLSMDMVNGKAEIPNKACVKNFMETGTSPIISPASMKNLGYTSYYGWGYTWTHPVINHGYAWQGAYGQKVWVDPVHERILIRFGHYRSKEQSDYMGEFFRKWRNGFYDGEILNNWGAK